MRLSSHSSEAHTDVEQPSRNGTNGPTFLDDNPLIQMAHCFAHPETSHSVFSGTATCPGGRQLLHSFSTCSISPFALRSSADVPVACDMADQSPFARLTNSCHEQDTPLPPGRCSAPDAALPAAHVHRVILPRVQKLLPSAATLGVSSFTTAASSVQSSAASEQRSQQDEYPENHQLDDIMHVMQQHAANPFAMKENAAALTEELRVFLHIASSPASNLGPAPAPTANPTQFICACLHRANLLFILADLLFLQHATVNPETGFGLANTPIAPNPRVACVREAEGLVVESLALHDKAMQAYWDYVESRSNSRSSSPRVGGTAHVPSMMGAEKTGSGASANSSSDHEPPFVNAAAAPDLEPELRSSRFVQPRSKVMLRFALIQAALGKREQAVETLHEISRLDPWIPELELRPPEVAHAHRLSVEQAKSGLVWYYNSSHNSLQANRYRDDAMLWKMHRMSEEVNSQWEPADLLPHRAKRAAAAATTDDLRARTASIAAAVAGGNDDSRSRSAPLLRRAQHFRAPVPVRDPQAGKSAPEQHMMKLLRDAQEAGDKELTISILARAIEHGAATTSAASPVLLEPLIEHSYHVVSAANPSCATTYSTAVQLLLHALELLRDSCSAGASGPASAESVERLKLRRRAVHALATALHQNNRVSEPLALQRRALAHALHTAGNPEAVSTLEPRVHIAALSIVRLYMLSEDGSEDLARVADRPDCCEGSWKTLYGRGRPGQNNRFFQPVVKRDNGAEISNVASWLHQQLRMGIRILTIHLLRLAYAATERLQNLPEPSVASSHLPPRLTSPLPSRTPSSANLPLIHEAGVLHEAGEAGEGDSMGSSHRSQRGGDTQSDLGDDLGADSSTDMATGGHTEDAGTLSESEVPSFTASNHGIFRNVSHRSRVLKVGAGRSIASFALQAAVEESKSFSVEDLVALLESTCEEADILAREAQIQHGFAVSQPPWVAHLCMPHWKIVLTMLTSNLSLATPPTPPSGPPLGTLTAQLSRVLGIYSEYFHSTATTGDGDSDTVFSLNLSPATNHTSTTPSPLGATPTTRPPGTSEATSATSTATATGTAPTAASNSAIQPAAPSPMISSSIATSQAPTPRSLVPALPTSTSPTSTVISSPTPQSSLRLTYRSGSLSVSLPATEAAVPMLVTKPTVESFGLEQDETTSISLGATPIPCMLSVCAGPEAASSSRGCGGPTTAESSGDVARQGDESFTRSSTETSSSDSAATATAAANEHEQRSGAFDVAPPSAVNTHSSATHSTHSDQSEPELSLRHTAAARSCSDAQQPVQSHSSLPVQASAPECAHASHASSDYHNGGQNFGTVLQNSADAAGVPASGSPPGSPSSTLSPQTRSHTQSTPVAIPPQAPESSESFSGMHAHHGHPFMGSGASSYPGAFSDNYPPSSGSCGSSGIRTVPFAPCAHIFGAGGTSLCTAALSDPMCVAGSASVSGSAVGSPPHTPPGGVAPQPDGGETPLPSFKNGLEVDVNAQPHSFGTWLNQPQPPHPQAHPQPQPETKNVMITAAAAALRSDADTKPAAPGADIRRLAPSIVGYDSHDPHTHSTSTTEPRSSSRSSEGKRKDGPRGMFFGPEDFNADAFNAVPSELRETHCRSPPCGAFQAVSAPTIVAAYSCWHTPHVEQDCESFADSGSPSSTDVDDTVFGVFGGASTGSTAGSTTLSNSAMSGLEAIPHEDRYPTLGASPLKPVEAFPKPPDIATELAAESAGATPSQAHALHAHSQPERGDGQNVQSKLKFCFDKDDLDRQSQQGSQHQAPAAAAAAAVPPFTFMHPPQDLPRVLSLDSPPTPNASATATCDSAYVQSNSSSFHRDNKKFPEDAHTSGDKGDAAVHTFMPTDNLVPRNGMEWNAPLRPAMHGTHALDKKDNVPVFVPWDPPHMSEDAQPDGGQNSSARVNEASALPPRVPSPAMPFEGAPAATPTCFTPEFTPTFAPPFVPVSAAHDHEPAAGVAGARNTYAGQEPRQGTPPDGPGRGPQDRAHFGGFARSRSPANVFRPPRPPSPCVSSGSLKRASQCSPGFAKETEGGDCGPRISGGGGVGGGLPEPAMFPNSPGVGGSSAPLLRAAEKKSGGAFGGLLWGRDGPGSAGGHMRARSVCLDNLDL